MQKNKIEIIEETVTYYSENPDKKRGLDHTGSCLYYVGIYAEPRMCAVGRCLIEPKKFQEQSKLFSSTDINTLACGQYDYNEETGEEDLTHEPLDFEDSLKEVYRGHDVNFWNRLQQLHDNDAHWDSNGLTIKGEEFVAKLIERYNN